MKKITIGFSSPNKWKIGAEAVKLWSNSTYSHVYIRYCDNENRDIVFQAAHGTIHPILYKNFLLENIAVEEIELEFTDKEYQEFRDFYYNKMGLKYAYLDLAVIFIHDCLNKIGISFNSKVPGYICSSLACDMLVSVKQLKFDKPNNLMRPDDINEALKKIQ